MRWQQNGHCQVLAIEVSVCSLYTVPRTRRYFCYASWECSGLCWRLAICLTLRARSLKWTVCSWKLPAEDVGRWTLRAGKRCVQEAGPGQCYNVLSAHLKVQTSQPSVSPITSSAPHQTQISELCIAFANTIIIHCRLFLHILQAYVDYGFCSLSSLMFPMFLVSVGVS